MVMTARGPVSMCEHNARRDAYILEPLTVARADGSVIDYWPLKRDPAGMSKPDTPDRSDHIPLVSVR
jgi:hypothetical protein